MLKVYQSSVENLLSAMAGPSVTPGGGSAAALTGWGYRGSTGRNGV